MTVDLVEEAKKCYDLKKYDESSLLYASALENL